MQSLARRCRIMPELLELLELLELPDSDEDDVVMLTDLPITPGEMERRLDRLAFGIECGIPNEGPRGALSVQLTGFLRQ